MDDDFNSSDIEFGPPEVDKRTYVLGQDSINAIIENAAANRLTSKRRVKQLQFGHGAPETRMNQDMWVRRFINYR